MRTPLALAAVVLALSTPALAGDWSKFGDRDLKQLAVRTKDEVWGVTYGNEVVKWDGRSFTIVKGIKLQYIDVGIDGTVVGVAPDNSPYRFTRGEWEKLPGGLSMISCGKNRDGFIKGVNGVNDVFFLRRGWESLRGKLSHVSVGSDNSTWGTNPAGHAFRFNEGTGNWDTIDDSLGLAEVDCADASHVWAVSKRGEIYRYDGRRFVIVPGKLARVSVGFDGTVIGVDGGGKVYIYTPGAKDDPAPRPKPRRVSQIIVKPRSAELKVGERLAINAEALAEDGRPIRASLNFKATNGGRIDGSTFVAHAAGDFEVWVTEPSSGVSRVVNIKVIEPARCARIILKPGSRRVYCGEAVALECVAYDQFGKAMDVPVSFSCEGGGGSFRGGTFYAGNRAGTFTLWAKHGDTGTACSVQIEIVEPIILSLITIENQVSRIRAGQAVRLSLKGWDQYLRPCELDLGDMDWGCSPRAAIDGRRLTFTAPRAAGRYTVTVRSRKNPELQAVAYIYVED